MKKTPVILLTNDDGYQAYGLHTLHRELEKIARVICVAPSGERSGVSHAITFHSPLRAKRTGEDQWSLDGTPADCVIFAIRKLMNGHRPDLVISGINPMPNLGEDVVYSGTVAGAREGAINGSPSAAFSMGKSCSNDELDSGASLAARLASGLLDANPHMGKDIFLNINIPVPVPEDVSCRMTRLGRRVYRDEIIERSDPRGGTYYWIGGEPPERETATGTDFEAVENGMISVTCLKIDCSIPDAPSDITDCVKDAFS